MYSVLPINALHVLLVTMLATTITSLYDLPYSYSLSKINDALKIQSCDQCIIFSTNILE